MTYTEVQNTLVVGKSSLFVNPRPGHGAGGEWMMSISLLSVHILG